MVAIFWRSQATFFPYTSLSSRLFHVLLLLRSLSLWYYHLANKPTLSSILQMKSIRFEFSFRPLNAFSPSTNFGSQFYEREPPITAPIILIRCTRRSCTPLWNRSSHFLLSFNYLFYFLISKETVVSVLWMRSKSSSSTCFSLCLRSSFFSIIDYQTKRSSWRENLFWFKLLGVASSSRSGTKNVKTVAMEQSLFRPLMSILTKSRCFSTGFPNLSSRMKYWMMEGRL